MFFISRTFRAWIPHIYADDSPIGDVGAGNLVRVDWAFRMYDSYAYPNLKNEAPDEDLFYLEIGRWQKMPLPVKIQYLMHEQGSFGLQFRDFDFEIRADNHVDACYMSIRPTQAEHLARLPIHIAAGHTTYLLIEPGAGPGFVPGVLKVSALGCADKG